MGKDVKMRNFAKHAVDQKVLTMGSVIGTVRALRLSSPMPWLPLPAAVGSGNTGSSGWLMKFRRHR